MSRTRWPSRDALIQPVPAAALFDEALEHLRTWPRPRLHAHGFGLMLGDPAAVRQAQRMQARRILVAEDILARLSASLREPLVLLKGLEVAQLYPATVQRPFADVDVLVAEGEQLWDEHVGLGFRPDPNRRVGLAHHHLPTLVDPTGTLGLEIHVRPNVPAWARVDPTWLLDTAQPSRTGVPGIGRPRDDAHALLMAMHCWKGGFTRLRDLLDAMVLASVSAVPVSETARLLGLERFWAWTCAFAEVELFGRGSKRARAASRALLPRGTGTAGRTRTRLLAPFLVANPLRVTRAHAVEYRLGRAARHVGAARSTRELNRRVE